MEIIRQALSDFDPHLPQIRLPVDRLMLAKRRWRGVAEDLREFGFDLEKPLLDGDRVFASESLVYVLAQKYESVLEIALADSTADAARAGWLIGNLHFALQLTSDVIRVADDPALRQLFAREGFSYAVCKRIFHPLGGSHSHGTHTH